ncbi:Membrane protein OS=Streptomyces microflavus OX=1919 GN=ltrA PE=4 SV=1 [Streptomyces microflavus]
MTMLQMVGVVAVLAAVCGDVPLRRGGRSPRAAGWCWAVLVMRIAMVLQWWRAARQSPWFHDACMANIRWTLIVQACWTVVAFVRMPIRPVVFVAFASWAPSTRPASSPKARQGRALRAPAPCSRTVRTVRDHRPRRGVVGTVASSSDLLGGEDGTQWTWNAIAVVMAGVGLTFGMWWMYFLTPFGDILVSANADTSSATAISPCTSASLQPAPASTWARPGTPAPRSRHRHRAWPSRSQSASTRSSSAYLLHTLLLSTADPSHPLLVSLTIAVLLHGSPAGHRWRKPRRMPAGDHASGRSSP